MFSNERNELRKFFFTVWQKHNNQLALEPLETQIAEVILKHPEYHEMLNQQDKDFTDHNPFLHLGLHLSLKDQLITNRPLGIRDLYKNLCVKFQDAHAAEHFMMDCLAEILWEAQQKGTMPDEKIYLQKLGAAL